MRKLKNVVLFILMVAMIFAMGNVAYAASASLSSSSSSVKTGETVNITVKVNSTEAWNLSLTASGGSLGGTTNVADAASSEVTQNVMTASFVASTAGSYTITLSGEVTGSDLNKKSVSESITITVTEPKTETPPEPVTPQQPTTPQTNTQPAPSTQPQPQTPKTPTVTRSFKDVNETVYVYNTESVNVRELDSASSTKLGGLSRGTAVTRTGISTDGSWSRVSYNGKTAYISSDYLTKDKPADATTNTVTNEVITTIATNEVANTVVNNVSGTVTNEVDGENIDDSGILRLKSLQVKGANISDVFKPYIYEYTINVASSIDKLEIEAEPNIEGATVEIMGNEGLQEGENIITIMLKSEDGQVATYQITANVGAATETQDTGFDLMYILYILIALIVIVIIAIIVLKIKMKNSGDYDEEDQNSDDIANKYGKGEDFNNSNIFDYDKEFKNDNSDYMDIQKMQDNTKDYMNNDYMKNDFMNDDNIDEDDRSSGRRGGKHF